jgi:hypothetical protein
MFSYHAVFRMGTTTWPATGLVAVQPSTGPYRAVIWSPRRRVWVFDPQTAALFLFSEESSEQFTTVDRSTAEEIARSLGTELPTEEELHQIIEQALTRR